jgi:pimeloyl-ACP methyl ester carboxylesterase
MPYAHNGSARLHWEERGTGTPLLLVMGHSYSSAMWYPVLDALSEHHRVIWFDNRGTGQSSAVTKLTVGDMARDAFAVLDAAGVDAAHVYGVSRGGGIILEMARQHPARIRSLLLGCTLAKTPDVPGVPAVMRPLLHLPAPLLYRLLTAMKKRARANPYPYGTKAPADKVAYDESVVAANVGSMKTSVEQSKAINAYSITEAEVRALTMPALVLHGDEDAAVAYEAGVKLHGLIAHSELVTFEGAGHNYFVAAGDEANAAVLDFLGRVDATQAEGIAS